MEKEYRNVIISGIVGAILTVIFIYVRYGEIAWAFLFIYPPLSAAVQLYLNKRREEKKDQEGVR